MVQVWLVLLFLKKEMDTGHHFSHHVFFLVPVIVSEALSDFRRGSSPRRHKGFLAFMCGVATVSSVILLGLPLLIVYCLIELFASEYQNYVSTPAVITHLSCFELSLHLTVAVGGAKKDHTAQ